MPELAYREVCVMNQVEARRRLIQSYEETGSYSQTARLWHTSRHVVRKWVRRYQELGEDGLEDQSRRPHHCPRQTPPETEEQVMAAWEETHYGCHRLAVYLARHIRSVISCAVIVHLRNDLDASLSTPPIGLGRSRFLSPSSKPMSKISTTKAL